MSPVTVSRSPTPVCRRVSGSCWETYGISVEEEIVARACQTTPAGTMAGLALEGLRLLGYGGALVEEGTLGFLLSSLTDGQPVIAFLWMGPSCLMPVEEFTR